MGHQLRKNKFFSSAMLALATIAFLVHGSCASSSSNTISFADLHIEKFLKWERPVESVKQAIGSLKIASEEEVPFLDGSLFVLTVNGRHPKAEFIKLIFYKNKTRQFVLSEVEYIYFNSKDDAHIKDEYDCRGMKTSSLISTGHMDAELRGDSTNTERYKEIIHKAQTEFQQFLNTGNQLFKAVDNQKWDGLSFSDRLVNKIWSKYFATAALYKALEFHYKYLLTGDIVFYYKSKDFVELGNKIIPNIGASVKSLIIDHREYSKRILNYMAPDRDWPEDHPKYITEADISNYKTQLNTSDLGKITLLIDRIATIKNTKLLPLLFSSLQDASADAIPVVFASALTAQFIIDNKSIDIATQLIPYLDSDVPEVQQLTIYELRKFIANEAIAVALLGHLKAAKADVADLIKNSFLDSLGCKGILDLQQHFSKEDEGKVTADNIETYFTDCFQNETNSASPSKSKDKKD